MPIFSGDMRSPQAGPAAARLIRRIQQPYTNRDRRARIARALIHRDPADADASELGIHVPKPFDTSQLIYKYMGDLSEAATLIANILSENEPFFLMDPIRLPRGSADRANEIKKDQQDLLNAEWWAVNRNSGRDLQRMVAWGQVVDGVGWYYSLPRDMDFGLPARDHYEERTDDEIEEMIRSGKALRNLEGTAIEGADVWFGRRREARKQHALDGRTLFHLEALSDPEVYVSWDAEGIGMGCISTELEAGHTGADSLLSELASDFRGDPEIRRLGIRLDKDGNITHGPGPKGDSGLTLHKLWTRDETVFLVSGSPSATNGTVIFHTEHQMNRVPLHPVAYYDNGDPKPDRRYISALDGPYAFTPLINQALTFLTNVGAYRAFPRYVVEVQDGTLVDQDGNPKVIEKEETVGLDPQEIAKVAGKIKPLDVGDPSVLQSVVGFFLDQDKDVRPKDAERGAAANSTAAWSVRINDANAQRARKAAVDNHASAVEKIGLGWIHDLRQLKDAKIGFVTAPGERSTRKNGRYLVEVNPKDLVSLFRVEQTNLTQEERAIDMQLGQSLSAQGQIDDLRMVRDFFHQPNAEQYVIDMYAQAAFQAAMMGPNDRVPPGSLLMDIAQAARGVAIATLQANSPAFAIELAKMFAEQQPPAQFDLHPGATGHQGGDDFDRGLGGASSQAAGVTLPGMGAGVNQAALPGAGGRI